MAVSTAFLLAADGIHWHVQSSLLHTPCAIRYQAPKRCVSVGRGTRCCIHSGSRLGTCLSNSVRRRWVEERGGADRRTKSPGNGRVEEREREGRGEERNNRIHRAEEKREKERTVNRWRTGYRNFRSCLKGRSLFLDSCRSVQWFRGRLKRNTAEEKNRCAEGNVKSRLSEDLPARY